LDKEPVRVQGIAEYDAEMGTDSLTSGILDFGTATSLFTCSTLLVPYQNFRVFGTEGFIEIEVPVTIAPDQHARIWLEVNRKKEEIILPPVNQYTLQCDHFSKAILDDVPVPLPLKDAINNMKVIDGIRESAGKNTWISIDSN
jgi:predicted dehydrogenase